MAKDEKAKVKVGAVRQDPGEDTFSPLVDIYENGEDSTVLVIELPGADADSLDIRVDKGVLSIYADGRGEESGDEYARTYTGFARGQYFRAFAVSDEVDRDNIEALYNNGILTLTLPRASAAETKKIEIKER